MLVPDIAYTSLCWYVTFTYIATSLNTTSTGNQGSGTNRPISLRACYGKSGTDLAYGLRACYRY
eukprot:3507270-Rhodomonas_salina.1